MEDIAIASGANCVHSRGKDIEPTEMRPKPDEASLNWQKID